MKKLRTSRILSMVMVAVLAITMLAGCNKEEEDEPIYGFATPRGFMHFGPSLITNYMAISGLEEQEKGEMYDYRSCKLRPTLFPSQIGESGCIVYNGLPWEDPDFPYDKGDLKKKALFQELCNLNGDTAYNESVPFYKPMYHKLYLQHSWIEEITEVRLTAVSDFDSEHRAGSSLDDMAYITYWSEYPLIQEDYRFNERSIGNGYYPGAWEHAKELYGEDSNDWRGFLYRGPASDTFLNKDLQDNEFTFHCKVPEVRTNPIRMSYSDMILSFERKPQQACEVKAEVTVQYPGGKYPPRTYTTIFRVR